MRRSITLLVAVFTGIGCSAFRAQPDLLRQCETTGRASIRGATVWRDRTLVLRNRCVLSLADKATLVLDRVHLTSSGLFIGDEAPNGATRVEIVGSELRGDGAGADLHIQLEDRDDRLLVDGSEIAFDHGVWAVVAGDGRPDGGHVEMARTRVAARGRASKGVLVMAGEFGGVARFADVVITVGPGASAALFAGNCTMERVTGAPPRCAPP